MLRWLPQIKPKYKNQISIITQETLLHVPYRHQVAPPLCLSVRTIPGREAPTGDDSFQQHGHISVRVAEHFVGRDVMLV